MTSEQGSEMARGARRRRFTDPAMIVAGVSLFVALGGVAWALSANSVKSKHIVDGAVKPRDLKQEYQRGNGSDDVAGGVLAEDEATVLAELGDAGVLTFSCGETQRSWGFSNSSGEVADVWIEAGGSFEPPSFEVNDSESLLLPANPTAKWSVLIRAGEQVISHEFGLRFLDPACRYAASTTQGTAEGPGN